MTESERAAFARETGERVAVDGKRQTVETHLQRAVNALFLARQFAMRLVEKTDEWPLLAHFTMQATDEVNGRAASRKRRSISA